MDTIIGSFTGGLVMAKRMKKKLLVVLFGPASVTTMVLVGAIVFVLMSILSSDPAAAAGPGLIKLSRTAVVSGGFTEEEVNLEMFPQEPVEQWETVRMRVTAYCACSKCCGKFADGRTANNHKIRRGDTFAAADKKYRFGTELVVPGYNDSAPVKIIDRGKAIVGDRLDVFYHTHGRAKKWGVQYLDVKVKQL